MPAKQASHLQVVAPDAKAERKVPAKIAEALDGSSRDVLASMRRALAKKLDDGEVSSNAIASAYKELRELDRLVRLIDARAAEEGVSGGPVEDEAFDASAV